MKKKKLIITKVTLYLFAIAVQVNMYLLVP